MGLYSSWTPNEKLWVLVLLFASFSFPLVWTLSLLSLGISVLKMLEKYLFFSSVAVSICWASTLLQGLGLHLWRPWWGDFSVLPINEKISCKIEIWILTVDDHAPTLHFWLTVRFSFRSWIYGYLRLESMLL